MRIPLTSMPRAATSVATSTRTAPDLKSFKARSRWFWERFEWMMILIPLLSSRRAIRSAPCLVREKTRTVSKVGLSVDEK